jgi:hypothetical protein
VLYGRAKSPGRETARRCPKQSAQRCSSLRSSLLSLFSSEFEGSRVPTPARRFLAGAFRVENQKNFSKHRKKFANLPSRQVDCGSGTWRENRTRAGQGAYGPKKASKAAA